MMPTPAFDPDDLILPPDDPAAWDTWRAELGAWRDRKQKELDLSRYSQPEFAWVRDCLVCGMAMLFDEEFWNLDRYLARMRSDFGGVDALVLWQAYPRIGIDSRNQFDHYRLAPHLKPTIEELHRRGIRAFMGYNPWDVGTRREPVDDAAAIAATVQEFGFDGVFLDTLPGGTKELRQALDRSRPGVVMESELALAVEGLPDHGASWVQWFEDGEAPGVLRDRWLERGHMMHTTRRWDRDHSGELQMAWMNGAGVLVWENVFGSWNGWNDRDKATLRAMSAIRRRFPSLFREGTWEPLVPCTQERVFASRWSLGPVSLWTLVNRAHGAIAGSLLPIAADRSARLFDLVRGIELDHAETTIEGRGIGAIVALPSRLVTPDFLRFLSNRRSDLAGDAAREDASVVRLSPLCAGEPRPCVSRFRARECGEYGYADFTGAYPELHFERRIVQFVPASRARLDDSEVTNGQFWDFVRSGYRPKDKASFLLHWEDGRPKPDDMDRPVVFVDLDDARAYARWAGKRLPTEYEWQTAAPSAGGVWNWTESEHFDGHTRFSILKGGADWQAKGSVWYFEGGRQAADRSAKYIHFGPALDRCETIGFRCAKDAG